ncbi:unnamed protein product [Closterium sp. NIES-53]
MPITERAHFSQHRTAKTLYDAVVARYSSPATAAICRLMLPYLFPDLSSFTTAEDLVSHLRATDSRFCAALSADSVRDHFLALDPTTLTVDDFEKHLFAVEKNILAVGAARGTPHSPLFEGCSPSPLTPSYASAAAAHDYLGAEEVGAASAPSGKRRSGRGGRGGMGGGGGGGGGGGAGGGGGGGGGGGRGGGGGGGGGGGSGGTGSGGGGSSGSGGGGSGGGSGGLGQQQPQQQQHQRQCQTPTSQQLLDCVAWRAKFPDAPEFPNWADLLRRDVPIFDLDYEAILAAMYALSVSAEVDCYLCVPPAPGITPGIAPAALGACESAPPGPAPAQALHTFTLESGASRCFFRDSTRVTPLPAPVPVSLADPSGGPVLARSSIVLPCPAVLSGELSGLHLPSFSTNLVSNAVLQDAGVYTFSLGSGSLSWRSTRSSSVLGSSYEAEIYATAMAAQELRWLTYLLIDLGERPRSPPVLYVDNKAAIALCQEHRLEHRTKHIALRYFLARELQQRGQLHPTYVATRANTADIFTKALPPGDHRRFCTLLGLVPTLPHLLLRGDVVIHPELALHFLPGLWQLSQPELEELRSQLDYLLAKGFIRPSTSPFAAPILFTSKKDGGLRMCIDYRALNRVMIKSRYPIPRADDLLDQLRGSRYFLKIDLRGGYHQIRVFADDCPKTAFPTRYGSYEYTVMPFGLTNAPSTFQLTMNGVLRDMLDKKVIVYLDDILVYSKTKEEHFKDLEEVFRRLQHNRLITKGYKCEFLKPELEFLGHVVSGDGIKIDPRKVNAIAKWNPPTNITELQSFLGFVNYVRRFVPNMAGVTKPLTDLLHEDASFQWGEREQSAFDTLENISSSPPVLRLADPS